MARATDEAKVVWSPVQDFDQAIADPQMQAAGCFVDMPKPDGSSYRNPASPIRFRDDSTDPKRPLPEVGEHTLDVLRDIGIDEETCQNWLEQKIIGQHSG